MTKNPKTTNWSELDVLKVANQVDDAFVIKKIDGLGKKFQGRLLSELMSNSLRLQNMAKTDPYVNNIEKILDLVELLDCIVWQHRSRFIIKLRVNLG